MKTANCLRKRAVSAAVTAGAVAIASAGLAMSASAAPGVPVSASHAAAASYGTADNFRALDNSKDLTFSQLKNSNGFEASPVTKTVTLHLSLTPMPQGQLVLGPRGVHFTAYGFTPGSSHEVAVSFVGLEVSVGTLTANAGGAVNWSASLSPASSALARHGAGMDASGATSASVQLVVLDAGRGSTVIAQTPAITGPGTYPVHAVEPGWGVIKPGSATIVYNPSAKTVSVTVNATGLTPGNHVAHIHVGSCQRQGGVVYTLTPDFTANSHGVISNETRTVKGVAAAKLSGGWYLNLHQGNRSDIVSASGQPTINFRPLLCANL